MKYTVTEYNEGNEKKVFEGTEREVFEYLQDSEYYTFLDESDGYEDRMEYAEYRESLEYKSIESVYCPDYSWYKLEITDEDENVVNKTKNPGRILAVIQTKNAHKDAIFIGTRYEAGDFLVGNKNNNYTEAYYLYMEEFEGETDKKKMKILLNFFDDSEDFYREYLNDGMTKDEAFKKVYKDQVAYIEYIITEIEEKLKRRNRWERSQHLYELELAMGMFGTYGLEVVTR